MRGFSVIIPSWNGWPLLAANVPSVEQACRRLDVPSEILLVDDASNDGTSDHLARSFPAVRVLRHPRNRGFNAAIQTGVAAARYDVFYCLNNDVRVEPGAFEPLLPHFVDARVFAVASMDAARQPPAVPAFTQRCGLLGVRYVHVPEPRQPMPVLFATGGHAAYRADQFRALGGFDQLFAPAYWEDIDLCTQAQIRGWRVLLEPRSRVHPQAGTSMSRRHSSARLSAIRAGHRWRFTLRYAPRVSLATIGGLVVSHGQASVPAILGSLRYVPGIRQQATDSARVLQEFAVPAVKRRHGVPWTIAYVEGRSAIEGGGALSLLTLIGALDRSRVQPLVVCPAAGEVTQRAQRLGATVEALALPSSVRGLVDGTWWRLVRWLRDRDVDAVHANATGRWLLLPALAARVLGLPVIWHARIADREPCMDRLQAGLATRIIVTSNFVAARFSPAVQQAKVIRIPNAVDLRQFHPALDGRPWRREHALPDDAIVAGIVGRLDAWKRFDLALAAIAIARARIPAIHLVVIGDGPERRTLEALAKRLGLGAAVSFVGWQTEMPPAFAALDLLMHPTPGEHFGRTLIEAMACGKPVIAAQSGAAAEIITAGETGLLCPPADETSLAAALVQLAGDPQQRARMGRAAAARARATYDAVTHAQAVQRVYDEIILGDAACPS